MPITATTLEEILDAVAATLGSVATLKVYDHEPLDLAALPAVTILLEQASRQGVEFDSGRVEEELGRVDLLCAWTVRLWSGGDYTRQSERAALQTLGELVGAVDADETLGGVVRSASAATATRERVVRGEGTSSEREYVTYVVTLTTTSKH